MGFGELASQSCQGQIQTDLVIIQKDGTVIHVCLKPHKSSNQIPFLT